MFHENILVKNNFHHNSSEKLWWTNSDEIRKMRISFMKIINGNKNN
jgi:hypothetical protein